MERDAEHQVQQLLSNLLTQAQRSLDICAASPDSFTGRKSREDALRLLTHVERLMRLYKSGSPAPTRNQKLQFTSELPHATLAALRVLQAVDATELIVALATFQKDVPCCACSGQRLLLPNRNAWRCRNCGRQQSMFIGTILENSHVPLWAWFAAVLVFSHCSDVSVATLARVMEVDRQATVRRVLRMIRTLNLSGPLHSIPEVAEALMGARLSL